MYSQRSRSNAIDNGMCVWSVELTRFCLQGAYFWVSCFILACCLHHLHLSNTHYYFSFLFLAMVRTKTTRTNKQLGRTPTTSKSTTLWNNWRDRSSSASDTTPALNGADNHNVPATQRAANLATARLRQQNKENALPASVSPTTATGTMAGTKKNNNLC